jgi:chemotaxis protein histidine kinase CheA
VLVITVGEKKYGLIVDALEGEEELVIKALDDQTFATDLVNGASILGDGKVVLILNLPPWWNTSRGRVPKKRE